LTLDPRAPLALVGPGAAGSALAAALSRSGWPIAGLLARTASDGERAAAELGLPSLGASDEPAPAFAAAPLVVLAVRDREIAPLAEVLAAHGSWAGRHALHLSGALTSDALGPLREAGAAVGSLHPLMTFAHRSGSGAPDLPPDTPFFAEGDPSALRVAAALAAALGCPFRVLRPEAKTLYHCAATVAGNLTTVLLGLAESILEAAGVEGGAAVEAPLARESIAGAARLGAARALTGPVARGDADIVAAHLGALESAGLPRELREAHVLLSELAANLAEQAGSDREALVRVRALLASARSELGASD
jgi:predicted short-subunit dehydrogenase-like oxidoreductase (DUF2520 family)